MHKGDYMLTFIGEIQTPYDDIDQCPRNTSEEGPLCSLVLGENYQQGLKGLKKHDKILILYWLHLLDNSAIEQVSLDDGAKVGVFSLRSPHRPNPIGAAVVEIKNISENIVQVNGLDCVNGTKLLDIKPAIMYEEHM